MYDKKSASQVLECHRNSLPVKLQSFKLLMYLLLIYVVVADLHCSMEFFSLMTEMLEEMIVPHLCSW